jgi:hypothetical protein
MQHFRATPHDDESTTIRRVAAIVGACPRCLGDDVACGHCEGQGSPDPARRIEPRCSSGSAHHCIALAFA